MKALAIDLLEWQKRFGTEEACDEALARQRWPEGFRCPRCGHDHGYAISTRHSHECSSCHYQASLTAGTLFHSTNLPLTKWFWAIYLMASDKGGISALRLTKQIGVSWITAHRMLRKIRIAMGHRDSVYRLHDLVEIDDALVGVAAGPGSGDGEPQARCRCWSPSRTGTAAPGSWPCNLQESLNEFCYRFNRRAWEPELPMRLLNACLTHSQVKLKMV